MSNVKNVEALARLVDFCTGYGGDYKPGHLNLQVENMNAMLTRAREVLLEVSTAKTAYENATDNREVNFADMDKLCTRIIGALKASGALPQTIDNARVMTRKLTGAKTRDRSPVEVSGEVKPKPRVARGQDYGSMVSHFEKLLQTLVAEPLYHPNETDLVVESLMAKLEALQQSNSSVSTTRVNWMLTRAKRSDTLYKGAVNLFDTAMTAKDYVKSIFGSQSEHYQQVVKIRFTKPLK